MDEITLTSATRTALQSLQRTSDLRALTSRRLSTGQEVQRATDDPVRFFQSQALTNRVSDLRDVKDGIGQALSAVETALDGTDAASSIIDQMRGALTAARGGTDAQRAAAADQFDQLRSQLTAITGDASYQGTSLISADADDLDVRFNENGSSSATIEGQSSDAASLGVSSAAAFSDFASDADIDAAIAQLSGATDTLRTQSANLGSDIALLSTRESFTENISNTLSSGSAKLTEADLNEEAARQLALSVRDQLGVAALQIAQQGQLLVRELF